MQEDSLSTKSIPGSAAGGVQSPASGSAQPGKTISQLAGSLNGYFYAFYPYLLIQFLSLHYASFFLAWLIPLGLFLGLRSFRHWWQPVLMALTFAVLTSGINFISIGWITTPPVLADLLYVPLLCGWAVLSWWLWRGRALTLGLVILPLTSLAFIAAASFLPGMAPNPLTASQLAFPAAIRLGMLGGDMLVSALVLLFSAALAVGVLDYTATKRINRPALLSIGAVMLALLAAGVVQFQAGRSQATQPKIRIACLTLVDWYVTQSQKPANPKLDQSLTSVSAALEASRLQQADLTALDGKQSFPMDYPDSLSELQEICRVQRQALMLLVEDRPAGELHLALISSTGEVLADLSKPYDPQQFLESKRDIDKTATQTVELNGHSVCVGFPEDLRALRRRADYPAQAALLVELEDWDDSFIGQGSLGMLWYAAINGQAAVLTHHSGLGGQQTLAQGTDGVLRTEHYGWHDFKHLRMQELTLPR